MLRTIANAFSVADIRKKLAFTAAMLALYRLGAYIPAPGRRRRRGQGTSQSNFGGSNILGFLNLFSGGSLSRLSPLRAGDHALHHGLDHPAAADRRRALAGELQKEGEVGQQKITQYTRYLTVGLAFAQSLGYVFLFRSFGNEAGHQRRRRR